MNGSQSSRPTRDPNPHHGGRKCPIAYPTTIGVNIMDIWQAVIWTSLLVTPQFVILCFGPQALFGMWCMAAGKFHTDETGMPI